MSDSQTQAQQAIAAMILDELQTYERFRLWVESNYDIHVFMNDEEKRIEVKVIEQDMALAQEALSKAVREKIGEAEGKIEVVGANALDNLGKG